jgi:hypothetical protein
MVLLEQAMLAVQKSSMAVCFYSMSAQAVSRRDGIYPTQYQLAVEMRTRAIVDG